MVNTISGGFRRTRLTVTLRVDHLILDRIPVVIDIAVRCNTQQRKSILPAEFVVALPHTEKVNSVQNPPAGIRIPDIGVTGVCRSTQCSQYAAVTGRKRGRIPASAAGHILYRLPFIICVVKKCGPGAVALIASAIDQNLAVGCHRHRGAEHVVALVQILLERTSVRIPDRAVGLLGCRPGTAFGPRISQYLTIWQYRHRHSHMRPVQYRSPATNFRRPANSGTNDRLCAFCVTRFEFFSHTHRQWITAVTGRQQQCQ